MNPFAKHTSNLFASKGCDLDSAMIYARELLDNINPEDRAAATTALMVVINTAANAWTQSQGPSPERIALFELIDQRITTHILDAFNDLDEQVDSKVSAWMSNNLDDKMDEWVQNSLTFEDSCDSRIESWIENNLDVSSQVEDYLNDNLNLEDKINDLDLVVRVR